MLKKCIRHIQIQYKFKPICGSQKSTIPTVYSGDWAVINGCFYKVLLSKLLSSGPRQQTCQMWNRSDEKFRWTEIPRLQSADRCAHVLTFGRFAAQQRQSIVLYVLRGVNCWVLCAIHQKPHQWSTESVKTSSLEPDCSSELQRLQSSVDVSSPSGVRRVSHLVIVSSDTYM